MCISNAKPMKARWVIGYKEVWKKGGAYFGLYSRVRIVDGRAPEKKSGEIKRCAYNLALVGRWSAYKNKPCHFISRGAPPNSPLGRTVMIKVRLSGGLISGDGLEGREILAGRNITILGEVKQ